MNELPNEDKEALRRAARRFLETHASSAQTRAAMATERGWDPAVWAVMARELGWAGLIVPEKYGGAGAGFEELGILFEETGRHLACSPLFATVCLGAVAILECGDAGQHAAWLPGIASGERTATLALTEREGRWDPHEVETVASEVDGGWNLRGTKRFVVDGHTADLLVVVARDPGTRDEDGICAFLVRGDAEGVERRVLPTMDGTRKLAEIALDMRVTRDSRLARGSWEGIARVLRRACIALAAEQVGGASRCLEMSVDYAKVRTQFQRPIGSFQAIKHKLADMYVAIELARSNAYYGAWALTNARDEPVAASSARIAALDAFELAARENIHIHGGQGFAWEQDCHLYFRRSRMLASALGTASYWKNRLVESMEPPVKARAANGL